MSVQSGHKRSTSGYNQPNYPSSRLIPKVQLNNQPLQYNFRKNDSTESIQQSKSPNTNSTKATKHGKGSIVFQSVPIEVEGELNYNRNSNRNNANHPSSYGSSPFRNLNDSGYRKNDLGNYSKLDNRNSNSLNLSNLNKSNNKNRSPTPNQSHFKGFKPSPGGIPISKVKKIELNTSTSPHRGIQTKSSSYYPRTARENLNNSNLSNNNRSKLSDRLNDTNNSFLTSDLLNKTRLTIRSVSNNKISRNNVTLNRNSRSNTPNRFDSKGKEKLSEGFSKSNSDLSKTFELKKLSLSKSPINNSRLTKKTQSVAKITTSNLSGITGSSYNIKNYPENSNIKNFIDFKNIKNATPLIYSSYVKKVQNTKMLINNGVKFGSSVKKVITGNLMGNMNYSNNLIDVSTNSSINKSKNEIKENPTSNNTNNTTTTNNNTILNTNYSPDNVNNNSVYNNIKNNTGNKSQMETDSRKEYLYQIPLKYENKGEGGGSNKNVNNYADNQRINNLQNIKKDEVNFREITTSPLLRVSLKFKL